MDSENVKRTVALGLDLGQSQDFAALAAVEKVQPLGLGEKLGEPVGDPTFTARGLKRYKLGTPYPEIVADVKERLADARMAGAALVVDALGCGAPVVDLLRAAGLHPVAVKVHGGAQQSRDDFGCWHIPKRDLVSALLVELQSKRIRLAEGMEFLPAIEAELKAYRVKFTEHGHDSYEAWRDQDHDDLTFALGLAVWQLRRPKRQWKSF